MVFKEVSLDEAIEAKKKWLSALSNIHLSVNQRQYVVKVNGQAYDVLVEEL